MTSLSAIARLSCSVSKLLCLCAFVLAFGTSPAFAQQGSGSHPAPAPQPTEAPKQPPAFPSGENPWEQNQLIMNSGNKPALLALSSPVDCFLPPLNGLSRSTVGVADLQIPAKAQHEKEDACSALRNNKISDAESHLQKAVKQAPGYSSAWVVLGQLLEAQHKSDQASAACSHPLATDSTFMPSYLCLADISARAEQWNEVLTLSNRALVVDPMNNPLAYDYNAAANLHLHRLPEAEKSALKAVEIDKANIDPRVHFLLAQIYEAKGERDKEAAQLREYLKFVTAPKVTAMVNGYLSQLESQSQPKK
jgi:tetratricopeptide (TPR) repeat protein